MHGGKLGKCSVESLHHVGSHGRGRVARPISRMRKVRLRKGAASGEIQQLLIGFCVLSAVSTLFRGTLQEELRL